MSNVLNNMAVLAVLRDDVPNAKGLCARALDIARREGLRIEVAYCALTLAICLSRTPEKYGTAATLLGTADALLERLGLSLEETETKLRAQSQALLKHAMGEQAHDMAYLRGRGLAVDAAVALALQAID
jgi:hypothetical protein